MHLLDVLLEKILASKCTLAYILVEAGLDVVNVEVFHRSDSLGAEETF